jgi:hypothetical protein
LAQGSADQYASEQPDNQVSPEVPSHVAEPEKCRLSDIESDGTKVYQCPDPSGAVCWVWIDPNGEESGVCGVSVRAPHKEIAKATEDPQDLQSDPQASPRGISRQQAQSCRLLRVDSDGTEVSDCGDEILYEYPDGSIGMAAPRSGRKLQGQSPGQTRQNDDQQGGDQQGGDQQSRNEQGDDQQGGDQQGGDQQGGNQQGGNQQGGGWPGFGCAART